MGKSPADSTAGGALHSYHHDLARRVETGDMKLRPMRLALTSAAGLLAVSNERGIDLPNQHALDAYLKRSPGQRDGVSGFLRHLCDEEGIELSLPGRNTLSSRRKRRQRLKQKLLVLIREDAGTDGVDAEWIRAALASSAGRCWTAPCKGKQLVRLIRLAGSLRGGAVSQDFGILVDNSYLCGQV